MTKLCSVCPLQHPSALPTDPPVSLTGSSMPLCLHSSVHSLRFSLACPHSSASPAALAGLSLYTRVWDTLLDISNPGINSNSPFSVATFNQCWQVGRNLAHDPSHVSALGLKTFSLFCLTSTWKPRSDIICQFGSGIINVQMISSCISQTLV